MLQLQNCNHLNQHKFKNQLPIMHFDVTFIGSFNINKKKHDASTEI